MQVYTVMAASMKGRKMQNEAKPLVDAPCLKGGSYHDICVSCAMRMHRSETAACRLLSVLCCWPCIGLESDQLCRILSEDKAMVESLHPEMLLREISVKADLPQTAFRKLRQSFIDLGFGVVPDANKERFRPDF